MDKAGIYIHIPFCRSRCSYCDFATGPYESSLADRYVSAVVRELGEWRETEAGPVDTIYFGGGTPSLLTPDQLSTILNAVHDRFTIDSDAEVTMEMNPAGSPKSKVQGPKSTIQSSRSKGGEEPSPKSKVQGPKSVHRTYQVTSRNDSRGSEERSDLRTLDPGLSTLDSALNGLWTLDSAPLGPGTLDSGAEAAFETLRAFRRGGINRASFGAQSFSDHELLQLGRTHSAEDIGRTFRDLRAAGFANISFDLIAGLPGQTLATWSDNVDRAIALAPDHISLYLLDVHEGTPLADQIQRGQRPKPDDDLAAEMYRLMIERLGAAGYEHYEISNFCRPGFASRHNSKYWTGAPYYSFGCSAHSFDGATRRWANERDVNQYVAAIESGGSPIVDRTSLDQREARAESIFLGLRMMRGIDLQNFAARFGVDLRREYREELARFADAGLMEIDDRRIRLTTAGALLSNEVFAAFV